MGIKLLQSVMHFIADHILFHINMFMASCLHAQSSCGETAAARPASRHRFLIWVFEWRCKKKTSRREGHGSSGQGRNDRGNWEQRKEAGGMGNMRGDEQRRGSAAAAERRGEDMTAEVRRACGTDGNK